MMRHYTEVYDINTKLNAMTMLAIHTPQAGSLKKMFKGHFINFKKYKVIGCDIKVACASTLPLNAEQVGLEAGEVDPRDVMNPMLFKACTGENLNALLNQIYNASQEENDTLYGAHGSVGEHICENVPSMRAYYQMLSDPTWRKAHPQAGLTVRNLKPYVHKVVTTQPFKWTGLQAAGQSYFNGVTSRPGFEISSTPTGNSAAKGMGSPSGIEMTGTSVGDGSFDGTNPSVFVSNGISPMPWLDTAIPQSVVDGEGDDKQANWLINDVPRVYCGCLIMPPGVSTKFYMRMLIDWKIAFKDWRPAYEIGTINQMEIRDTENGMRPTGTSEYTTYYNMYHDTSTKERMEDEQSSFTSNGAESDMVYAS